MFPNRYARLAFAHMTGYRLQKEAEQMRAARTAATANPGPEGLSFVYRGRFRSSGKFLFVAHPNCCPKCNQLGMTPHFFNTPDVAFITHPNCKCATVEAPAGLSPSQLMEWAKNPTGAMRFGFNYGVPLAIFNLTNRNRTSRMVAFTNRMRPFVNATDMKRRKVRADVTAAQVEKVRKQVAEGSLGPAKDFTRGIRTLDTKERKRRAAEESQRRRKAESSKPRNIRGKAKPKSLGNTTVSPRNKAKNEWKKRHK